VKAEATAALGAGGVKEAEGILAEALRVSGYASHTLENEWLISGVIDGQYSDEPLIIGEQFGLGGVTSVRGFEERAVTGDRGFRINGKKCNNGSLTRIVSLLQ